MKLTLKLLLAILILAKISNGQNDMKISKIETVTSFGLTSADIGQTCYHLATNKRWHERVTPSQNCTAIAAMNYSRASAALFIDKFLIVHNHPKWAHFQAVSATMAASGIFLTYRKEW